MSQDYEKEAWEEVSEITTALDEEDTSDTESSSGGLGLVLFRSLLHGLKTAVVTVVLSALVCVMAMGMGKFFAVVAEADKQAAARQQQKIEFCLKIRDAHVPNPVTFLDTVRGDTEFMACAADERIIYDLRGPHRRALPTLEE